MNKSIVVLAIITAAIVGCMAGIVFGLFSHISDQFECLQDVECMTTKTQ